MYSYHEIDEYAAEWQLESLSYEISDHQVKIIRQGRFDKEGHVRFTIKITSDGKISTAYQLTNLPDTNIREAGIKYIMGNQFDSLSWSRKGYWSTYPEGHLSNTKGKVSLFSGQPNSYRKKPEKDWILDTKSFYYDGTQDASSGEYLTHVARGTKENIYEYGLSRKSGPSLTILGNGNLGCRIEKKNNTITLFVNNTWDYVDLSWGNYQRNIKPGSLKGESIIQID
jgi:hypothetical protein